MKRYYKNLYIICKLLIFFSLFSPLSSLIAQLQPATSTDIRQALNKLNVLGNVLYIAAHPDDENTSVLAYMAQGKLVCTAYLSLTRGDGGQNLLGSEKGALLGVIRTQELLSARRIDGAGQFFSRAIDFGYSKSADETLRNWDRELILSDIVRVIRKFQPDIILTRFSETRGGHGHHISSAILVKEAFFAAADPSRFPEQLKELQTWQSKRIFWNTWSPSAEALSIDVGEYNPILGQSYQEFAAASRSMHKSQGFGVSPGRGTQLIYFDLTAGDSSYIDLFDGIDLTWKRVSGGEAIQAPVNAILKKYDDHNPGAIVPDLISLYRQIDNLPANRWIDIKKGEIQELLRMCSGIWFESIVWQQGVSPGSSIDVRSMVLSRSEIPVIVNRVRTTYFLKDSLLQKSLEVNRPFSYKQTVEIPDDAPYTQPFWLEKSNNGKMFNISDDYQIEEAEAGPALNTKFYLEINDLPLTYEIPVLYRWTDAVKGEQFRPFIVRPAINVRIVEPTYVFADSTARDIHVQVQSTSGSRQGQISLSLPPGWEVQPGTFPFTLEESGDQISFSFKVKPLVTAQNGPAYLQAEVDGRKYTNEIIEIDYNHIPFQTVLQPAIAHLVSLDIVIQPGVIGYIMGSGDDIPKTLSQLGYQVDLLSDQDLNEKDLSVYDAIICGIRAFNTRPELQRQQKRLIEYVEEGGTWIVQHNTRFGTQVAQIGPYPFKTSGRDRISEEDAPIRILMPEHPLFNYPNKITGKDFEDWIQERGLYFAESWEGKLYPLLSGNDQNEPAKLGGLLYTRYGKGVFIFTAYSWFRQLPAGVPGAYRLFINFISAEGQE